MIILGLDTTGPDCSVSIVDEAVVRAHISRNIGRGHAEFLADLVEEAFQKTRLTPADIDRLAVCTGPGSFTGLRVALAFAKGFALPRQLPVVGINALDVTAQELWIRDGDDEYMGVYRDIRRGEVFYGEYKCGDPVMVPRAMTEEEAIARANNKLSTVELFGTDTRILAWLAMDRDPASHPAEPLYSRGPDAKLPSGKDPLKPSA